MSPFRAEDNRRETDAFGTLDIPRSALYGIQTARTMCNLTFSGRYLKDYPEYVESLALVKKAAVRANVRTGELDPGKAAAIEAACNELIAGKHKDHFPVDILHGGGGIGTNMNMNEVIANLANELLGGKRGDYSPVSPSDHVNMSQSTSDVCHTAIRMAIVKRYARLDAVLKDSLLELQRLAEAFMDITTISRTCLQDGMRVKLGETFSGYAAVLDRRHRSLTHAIDELHSVNLGGTVIGSGVGAARAYRDSVVELLAETSGMRLSRRDNLFDAAQNIDDLAQVSAQLSLLAACLIKVAKDLRLLASGPEAGFAEILLPAVQAGSSFFPGKVNPVVPETLIQSCFQILGCDRVVQAVLEHADTDLNVFEGAAGANLLDAFGMLEKSLELFRVKCLAGLAANKPRCEQLANSFIPLVVELKETHGYSVVSNLLKLEGREGVIRFSRDGGNANGRTQA